MSIGGRLIYPIESKSKSLIRNIRASRRGEMFRLEPDVRGDIHRGLERGIRTRGEYSGEERDIIARVKQQTREGARNNVTRTECYRRMYLQYEELHWAMLAHMVSRNSGWCMTDLKGEWLPRLLAEETRRHLFDFYETANVLIFQDAYPQLLLYEESRRRGRNLFHLLPAFYVSRFMQPFWDHFWMHRDPVPLTIALIINEQHYIEKRVMEHEWFQKRVLRTFPFITQELLQMTQVVFPYREEKSIRLAGLTLEHFASLSERIKAGRQMYAVLFGVKEVYDGSKAWMKEVPHSGSRRDYWPGLFTTRGRTNRLNERLIAGKIRKDAPLLYSPELGMVWPDREPRRVRRQDWFTSASVLHWVKTPRIPFAFDMTGEYCFGLNKLERLALLMKPFKRGVHQEDKI
ncbi:DUF2515 family protein [Salibacterium halotolerans]|uniref:DUF2515 domain-containing protein n=1 Tax=Salibacterium halotolerans TaxID=1884432 RepID=A0A1I5RRV5_9BACI|nr:DUF2515 family protein [Salibacterium halotolerans]SFP61137.1 Protein of unknown function [Salibacterium halotolerans]